MNGYKQGRSKRVLLEAAQRGLTRQAVLRQNPWLTESALISVCGRNGIILESEKRKMPAKRGSVKEIAVRAHEQGIGVSEAVCRFGVNKSSLRKIAQAMGLQMKP